MRRCHVRVHHDSSPLSRSTNVCVAGDAGDASGAGDAAGDPATVGADGAAGHSLPVADGLLSHSRYREPEPFRVWYLEEARKQRRSMEDDFERIVISHLITTKPKLDFLCEAKCLARSQRLCVCEHGMLLFTERQKRLPRMDVLMWRLLRGPDINETTAKATKHSYPLLLRVFLKFDDAHPHVTIIARDASDSVDAIGLVAAFARDWRL